MQYVATRYTHSSNPQRYPTCSSHIGNVLRYERPIARHEESGFVYRYLPSSLLLATCHNTSGSAPLTTISYTHHLYCSLHCTQLSNSRSSDELRKKHMKKCSLVETECS